jgi:hypothetical protein
MVISEDRLSSKRHPMPEENKKAVFRRREPNEKRLTKKIDFSFSYAGMIQVRF